LTTSAGRLFDAVAALVGLRQTASYEGQAALELESALAQVETDDAYPVRVRSHSHCQIVDWEPMVTGIIDDLRCAQPIGRIAAKMHNTLAEMIVAVAVRADQERVVLSGGCFQNQYLLQRTVEQLRRAGFRPYWHRRIPPNDGGIAFGQVLA